jgi:enoyl-CoA hydratase/carnithine racemase
VQVLVFRSADPDYFISHVDLTRVAEYRAEAAKLTGEASIASLFHHLSASPVVTIAQVEGRVRGAGSEFVLACDMRFAASGRAIFGQFEPAFGQIPGGGAVQYLTRLMGRGRALEVLLTADDYDADLAERYGWINRALPADELDGFVTALASRIAAFPAAGHIAVKDRVNAISLAPLEDFRRDSDLFGAGVRAPETQHLIERAMAGGLQTRDGGCSWRRCSITCPEAASSTAHLPEGSPSTWLATPWPASLSRYAKNDEATRRRARGPGQARAAAAYGPAALPPSSERGTP